MARVKASNRPRSTASARAPRGRRQDSTLRAWAREYLLQWHTLGVLALLISVVLLPWAAVLAALGDLRDATVRLLGYGIFLILAGVAAVGFLLAIGRFVVSMRGLRWAGGLLAFGVAVWGVFGFFHPSALLAGASLADLGAGGLVGRLLVGTLPGLGIWIAAWLAGCFIFWPRRTLAIVRSMPPTAAMLLSAIRGLWRSYTMDTDAEDVAQTIEPVEAIESDVVDEPGPAPTPRAGISRQTAEAAEPPPATIHRPSLWRLPPLSYLAMPDTERAAADNGARAQLIVDTLGSFGVAAHVVQVNQGPTVTQFGVEPGWEIKTRTTPEKDSKGKPVLDKDGNPRFRTEEVSRTRVRVHQITSLANDLALAMAAPSIRIEAPVPGKPVVGIEVPNTTASLVTLRAVIDSPQFKKLSERSKLTLALGKGVSGEPVAADLARMPHLLIAGATGAGKSVCINSIIACILAHATPDEVRFIMVDPKRVELAAFGSIPHLALSKVIVDVEEVVGTLAAVIREMESRYKRFASLGVRNLEAYNRHPKVVDHLPFWVVIIDELADLMMAVPFEVERQICRLAQLARATGIHLVIATQRPSVDVVTGLIKANFPTRIAFAVSSQVDSRTILDGVGAEKLLGRGDMLFLATDAAKPRRLQGVYVSDQEIEQLVNFWTSERWESIRPPTYDHLVEEARAEQEREEQNDDPLFAKASELAQEHSRISVSMLQRRLRVGYPRAARLMDQLEESGIVGTAEGGQSRPVIGASEEGE